MYQMAKHQNKHFFALDEELGHGRSQSCLWAASHVPRSEPLSGLHKVSNSFCSPGFGRFTGHVSWSRMVCHSGGKSLAPIVQVLRWAQISIFALRDWADSAYFHSQCNKHLFKLDDSHAFCKGLETPNSLPSPTLLRQGWVLEGTAVANVTFSHMIPLLPWAGRQKCWDCL